MDSTARRSLTRSYHPGGYDPASNRLIVFGGLGGGAVVYNDVWILTDADGNGSPAWIPLNPVGSPPRAREQHRAVYDQTSNRLIVFGGIARGFSPYLTLDDVWVLTNANGLGGTPEWVQISPVGVKPQARADHSMVYDPVKNELTVFGGRYILPGTVNNRSLDDVWVLSNANGSGGTPPWSPVAPLGASPVARIDHNAALTASSDLMLMAMGTGFTRNEVATTTTPLVYLNDVWTLMSRVNALAGVPFTYNADATDPTRATCRPFRWLPLRQL